jgi:DNA-binding transcriptional MocR family regulator
MAKKFKLAFDSRGGVLVVSRAMRESAVYRTMTPQAKVLMDLLQLQWRNDRPVSFGVRESAAAIGCRLNTASKAFKELEQRGFIVCDEPSYFNSKTGSRARQWRLTWMPFMDKPPSHDWEKWRPEKIGHPSQKG